MRLKLLAPLAVIVVAVAAGSVAQAATRGHSNLGRVRHATTRFHDLNIADSAGYKRFVDVNGIACIDMPGMGAMGVHYVNGEFAGDAVIDPPRGRRLRTGRERAHLVAGVRVFKSAWDAHHKGKPKLFGQTFTLSPDGNRFAPGLLLLARLALRAQPRRHLRHVEPPVCTARGDEADMHMSAA
jgi:hypothetical protein